MAARSGNSGETVAAIHHKENRAITIDEHWAIVARETNPERKSDRTRLSQIGMVRFLAPVRIL